MRVLPGPDGAFRERRARTVEAPAEVAWTCVADLGGEPGWYAVDAAWRLRGVLDRALGGPGNRGDRTARCAPVTRSTGGGSRPSTPAAA
ncbi:DUF2867 domain-containing protein [Ornithinimicrobium flavum]|uniref:DUF2867 domain-containing protein n=1 Tax=Ornithinimicrobium flavum TaxID=1288636 RepID=UPI0010700272|nr:DUF2867 domain-containing protein [Ornithinimicrobium flavum]